MSLIEAILYQEFYLYYNLSPVLANSEEYLIKSFLIENQGDVDFKVNIKLNNLYLVSYILVPPNHKKHLAILTKISSNDLLKAQAFSINTSDSLSSGVDFLETQKTKLFFLNRQDAVRSYLASQERTTNSNAKTPVKMVLEYLLI